MKFISVLIIILSLFSCKKQMEEVKYFTYPIDLIPLAHFENGYVCSATKEVLGLGSIPWKANCEVWEISALNKFGMSVTTYEDTLTNYRREKIGCNNFHMQLGKQNIVSGASWQQNQNLCFGSYSRLLDDGDVLDASWQIDETRENFIFLDEINLNQEYIKGRFNLHFILKEQGQQNLHSERINFVNAQFTAKIVN